MAKTNPNKGGRPSSYTKEIGTIICGRIANGESLRTICKDADMPSAVTVHAWLLDEDKAEFLKQYETARNTQAETMFEELLEIADDNERDPQRNRLSVDTRKWYLSKVLPKKFGEKLDVTSGGEKTTPMLVKIIGKDDTEDNGDTL